MDQLFAYVSVAALAVTGLFSDLEPLIFAAKVVVGYFLVVFIVLSFIPGAASRDVRKAE